MEIDITKFELRKLIGWLEWLEKEEGIAQEDDVTLKNKLKEQYDKLLEDNK